MTTISPKFLTSASHPSQFPPDEGGEVAMIGRSNSGKSSALNAIVGRRALARTGKTPGLTRLVNFFVLGGDRRIVDLPGYGYARVSAEVRRRWDELLARYFDERRSLCGVLLTLDIRRTPSEIDRQVLRWAKRNGVPAAVLATKVDKLSRAQRSRRLRELATELGDSVELVPFSSSTREGVQEARRWVEAWLGISFPDAERSPGCGIQGTHPGRKSRLG